MKAQATFPAEKRADIAVMADHRGHLPRAGLAIDASLITYCFHQADHPVDVG